VSEPQPPGPRRSFTDVDPSEAHVWFTLGYRMPEGGDGSAVIEWDAGDEYTFPDGDSRVVHGGLVTTLLDSAMGGACWSVMRDGETFLTADLHVEFMRPARPGTLRAEGRVVQRTRRVAFCAAELHDADGHLLAAARCTQVIRS
jgi:uncharacterized protein (TIGR00369 family)